MKKISKLVAAMLPLIGGSLCAQAADYTLQILHASDLEGGNDAIGRAPNFAALVEYLENPSNQDADGTIVLSAGDNIIPGPFFNASTDFGVVDDLQLAYETLFGVSLSDPQEGSEIETRSGAIDITIMNVIGFDASAIGNHEFDLGSEILRDLLEEELDDDRVDGSESLVPAEIEWPGAQFPYLSANLDFSGDNALSGISTSRILSGSAFTYTPTDAAAFKFAVSQGDSTKIADAAIIDVDGEPIGVIGATTQRLNTISSPSGTTVIGATDNDIELLATQLQPVIDAVALGLDGEANTTDDVNKIVLVTHLQQIALETQLAALLSGVDVIIAGGSDTLLADANDTLRAGDVADAAYPSIVQDFDSNDTLIVSTDGEYSYLGRLNVPFDSNGLILTANLDDTVNGPIATTDAQVASLWGDLTAPFASGTKGEQVKNLVNPVTDIVSNQDGKVFGYTAVFLDGARSSVRTEETNLGNLTADANLWAAKNLYDANTVVSIKNGGGLRAIIGEIDGVTGELLPPPANPNASPAKPAGAISELDIANSARFNNELVLLDLSVQDLLEILEHAYSDSFEGNTPGRFAQLGGLQVSFTPPFADPASDVVINSFALVDFDGKVTEVLYKDGAFVADPNRELRVVTLNFLAGGGDGYDFPTLGANPFDTELGEQQALQQYLQAEFSTPALAYSSVERDPTMDTRVQNADFRLDTVGINAPVEPAGALRLTPVASYESGVFDESAAEIVAHDVDSQRLFVVSSAGSQVRVLDASDPENNGLPQITTIAAPLTGFIPNSVDTFDGSLGRAVAVAWADGSDSVAGRGVVTLYNPDTYAKIGSDITVGFLPDMLTFTPDGSQIVVANEGEALFDDDDNLIANPVGSVSVIDFSGSYANPTHTEIGFDRWNRRERILRARGVLMTQLDEGFAANVAQDLEPEYVAVTEDGLYAWVSLQENNAVALIDLNRKRLRNIIPLGMVDHSRPGSSLDASDRDGGINITTEPTMGLRQPDAIATMTFRGRNYLFTANEGDARDFEEIRFKDVGDSGEPDFDSSVAATLTPLQADDELGRLEFNKIASDLDRDGDIDAIVNYGGRSMTIYQAPAFGRFRAVRDTGSDLESFTASRFANVFNSNNDDNDSFESRSDAKGAEPEALTLAEIEGRTFAFLGLERQSAIMVYDVTDPRRPAFQDYASNRVYVDGSGGFLDVETPAGLAATGDLGPEDIEFIAAADSPLAGVPMIAVANEVSGTVTLWRIDLGL